MQIPKMKKGTEAFRAKDAKRVATYRAKRREQDPHWKQHEAQRMRDYRASKKLMN